MIYSVSVSLEINADIKLRPEQPAEGTPLYQAAVKGVRILVMLAPCDGSLVITVICEAAEKRDTFDIRIVHKLMPPMWLGVVFTVLSKIITCAIFAWF